MRRCHTQSVELPIQRARFRVDHETSEFKRVLHCKRNVNSIDSARGERGIVNPRRQRMPDWVAHNTEHSSVKINVIDPKNLTQVSGGQLAGSGSSLFFKRTIS